MKKHIFGLALFSFIVSAAAIVYALFSIPEIIPVYEIVSTPQYIPAERTHCKMKRETKQLEISSPIVTQAVYSVKTKRLTWKYDSAIKDDITFLELWMVDEKGVHNIDSIPAEDFPQNERVIKLDSQDLNLNKLLLKTNLYLIPDTFRNSSPNYTEYHPRFDTNKAITVTVDYGK